MHIGLIIAAKVGFSAMEAIRKPKVIAQKTNSLFKSERNKGKSHEVAFSS